MRRRPCGITHRMQASNKQRPWQRSLSLRGETGELVMERMQGWRLQGLDATMECPSF